MTTLGRVKDREVNPLNRRLTKSIERIWQGIPPPNTYQADSVQLLAPEPCWVEGCDQPAAFMPYLLKHYVGGGRDETSTTGVDQDCPFLCEAHCQENALAQRLGRGTYYTDRKFWGANIIKYRPVKQPQAA